VNQQAYIQQAFQRLYLVEKPTTVNFCRYSWQTPLMLPQDLQDMAEFEHRVSHAGELWLQNHDLRSFNLLIITHQQAKVSYAFQKPQLPNQIGLQLGPVQEELIQIGEPLPPYPLIFGEYKECLNYDAFI
jgi:hypothetical protein